MTSSERKDTLVFDSIFYNREIVNDANSDASVTLRISDIRGDVIIDNLEIQPGAGVSVKQLERNTEYRVEIKTSGKQIFLNIF